MNESPNEPKSVPPRVVDLVSELTDGSLSAEGREELRQLLAADSAALDWYCQWMRVHSLLYLDLQHPCEAVITPNLDKSLSLEHSWRAGTRLGSKKRRWALGLSAATITALAASLFIMATRPAGDVHPGIATTKPGGRLRATPELIAAFQRTEGNAVAVLSRAADAVWGQTKPLAVGSPVAAGNFAIASGVVQLEFLSGANVVVEGPAKLDLKSTMLIVCHEGKLRAHVPPQAKGFMIDTPHHRAVDLGTEFAVDVAQDQGAEVHVLDGEVELFTIDDGAKDREPRNLTVGDALSARPSGELTKIAAAPDKFIGTKELLSRSKEESAARLALWRDESQSQSKSRRIFQLREPFALAALATTGRPRRRPAGGRRPGRLPLGGRALAG
jgi:hypothetical protein